MSTSLPPSTTGDCAFCGIARDGAQAVVLYEDTDVVAFLDRAPIRPGHAQVIPRRHVVSFDELPGPLATTIVTLAQRLAMRMKAVFHVERVALLFSGGDVAHVHAHVIPLHEKTDITSARYLVSPQTVAWDSSHLEVSRAALVAVRDQLGFAPRMTT